MSYNRAISVPDSLGLVSLVGDWTRLTNRTKRGLTRFLLQAGVLAMGTQMSYTLVLADETFSADARKDIKEAALWRLHAMKERGDLLEGVQVSVQDDDGFQFVSVYMTVPLFDLASATAKELLPICEHLVDVVGEFLDIIKAPGRFTDHEYLYRGYSCSIAADEELWEVSGQDLRNNSGGVLEWCFDERDAQEVLSQMSRFPERFTRLSAQKHRSGPGMNRAVKEMLEARQPAEA